MIAIQRILCPTDCSEPARQAVQHADRIARWFDAELLLLHVAAPFVPPSPGIGPPVAVPYPGTIVLDPAVRAPVIEEMEAEARGAREAGVSVEVVVEEGEVVKTILAQAEARGADLIAVGMSGLGGGLHRRLGSVAEKVVQRAPVPVLTVPARARVARAPDAFYRRILCPVDFSETSLAAVEWAVTLARESAAHLTLLHAHEDVPAAELVPPGEASRDASGERRALEAELRRLATEAALPEPVEAIAMEGEKAADTIVGEAARRKADLLVMGVRGRRLLDRALFGSTTQHVVHAATCPVLTVRPPQG
jgi:nucleotide-binding universal stress UspA family protein